MYSEQVMDHFMNPRNVGEIENPDGVGEVAMPGAGDIMKVFMKRKRHHCDVKFKPWLRCRYRHQQHVYRAD